MDLHLPARAHHSLFSPQLALIGHNSLAFRSLNKPSSFLPQGICKCHTFCPEHSSSKFYICNFLASIRPHLHTFPIWRPPLTTQTKVAAPCPLVPPHLITPFYCLHAQIMIENHLADLFACIRSLSPSPTQECMGLRLSIEDCCISQYA